MKIKSNEALLVEAFQKLDKLLTNSLEFNRIYYDSLDNIETIMSKSQEDGLTEERDIKLYSSLCDNLKEGNHASAMIDCKNLYKNSYESYHQKTLNINIKTEFEYKLDRFFQRVKNIFNNLLGRSENNYTHTDFGFINNELKERARSIPNSTGVGVSKPMMEARSDHVKDLESRRNTQRNGGVAHSP